MGGASQRHIVVAFSLCACRLDTSGHSGSGGDGVGEGESTSVAVASSDTGAPVRTDTSGGEATSGSGAQTQPGDSMSADVTSATDDGATTDEPQSTGSTDDGDPTSTVGAICGNGMIEEGEECETGDLAGAMCGDKGDQYTGEPGCSGCQIDLGPCCIEGGRGCLVWADDCCGTCILFVCA